MAYLNNSCRTTLCTRYPVFTALLLKIKVFCDVTPSRLVNSYRRLEVRCLHLQGEVAQGQSTRRHMQKTSIISKFQYGVFSVQLYYICVYLIQFYIVKTNLICKKLIFRILMF